MPGSFGGTFEDFQGDIHPEDRERVLRSIAESLAGPRGYDVEYRILPSGGGMRWVEGRGMLVRDGDGEAGHLSQWAGLAQRSPVTAAVMTLFLLSLAGMPLTAGFTGKFAAFRAAMEVGAWPLVVVAVLASAVAAFFYLRVIVLMYFSPPAADGPTVGVPGLPTTIVLAITVLSVEGPARRASTRSGRSQRRLGDQFGAGDDEAGGLERDDQLRHRDLQGRLVAGRADGRGRVRGRTGEARAPR